jgi:hypothetical protein
VELPFTGRNRRRRRATLLEICRRGPIVALLMKKLWLLASLLNGRIPHEPSAA